MTYFLIILTVNIAVLALIYVLLKRRIDKKSDPEILLSGLEQEVEGLITDLNSTTERNLVLLEQRVKDLKGVIEEADSRVLLLKKETRSNDKSRKTYEHLRQKISISKDHQIKEEAVELSKPKQAVALFQSGLSLEEISKKLSLPLGEVELMISMASEQSYS